MKSLRQACRTRRARPKKRSTDLKEDQQKELLEKGAELTIVADPKLVEDPLSTSHLLAPLLGLESAALEAWLVAQAETAIAIDPAYPDPVGLLAVHYLDRDIDRSLAYFARLAELVPGDQDVQRQLREALAIRDAAR